MSRSLSFAFLSAVFIYGLSAALAPSALAVNCDLNACMAACNKTGSGVQSAGRGCSSWCAQTMEERKAKGQCKK
jgi:hypothetical protein